MGRCCCRTGAAALVVLGLAAGVPGAQAATAEAPATTAAPGAELGLPPISAERAASLAAALDAGLKKWFPPSGGPALYQWDGGSKVVPAGDHYDVELPSLQVVGDDGSRAVVGVVRLALTSNADGSWGVGLAVPSRVTLLAADGKPEGEISVGSQRFIGRWLPSLGTFTKADGSFGDLKAVSTRDKTRLEVGAVTVRTDLTEQPAGRWTGPSTFVINNLSMVDDKGIPVGRLGGAAIEATVAGMDIAHAVALSTETEAAPAGKAGKEDAQASMRRHLAMLYGLFGGASAKLRLNDLTMTTPGDGSTFSIGQIALTGGVEGLNSGKSTVSIGYSHDGLKAEPNPAPKEFTPEKVEFAVSLADLPNAGLWSAFEGLFKPAPGLTEEQTGALFAQQAQMALTQAGSRLRVDSLRLDTPAAAASVKGEARFNGQSILGVTAAFDMVARGLDSAAKQLQPAPGAKVDEDTQSTLAMLSMLQVMGAPGKDEAGRDVRTYKLELGADGRILLNGADMSALLQSAGPQDGGGKGGSAKAKKNSP